MLKGMLSGGRRFLPRSLRWRLQFWLAFLLFCLLTGFGIAVYQLQRLNHDRQIDGELGTRISALIGAVRQLYVGQGPSRGRPPGEPMRRPPPDDSGFGGPPPDYAPGGRPFDGRGFAGRGRRGPGWGPPERKPPELQLSNEAAALFGARPGEYYYIVWYRDGSVLKRSPGAPQDLTRPDRADRDTLQHFRTRDQFREALTCSGMGDCVLAGRSLEGDSQAMRNFAWGLLAAGGGILALGLGLGYWFTDRAIRPIERISAAATRISQGNLSDRVEGADSGDELGRLAAVLNSTFARLESAFARQRQFTADAAHELRTPLAVIISEAQTTLARGRTAEEYRETVGTCLDVAQQMRRLTESLLELARFDAGDRNHPRSDVDLSETARVSVERVRALAEQHGIQIQTDLDAAHAFANGGRLEQVITNLLTNAIYYNTPEGSVRVVTRSEPDAAEIAVIDTGIGIAKADLPHVFDRFYRGDTSRSRADGHTGLGLAISKAIVEQEGGTIEVASVVNSGTTFTVRMPRTR